MKEIITEINKRSEYLKPDKSFTKKLRAQVLSHAKKSNKKRFNFWAIIGFSQAIAFTLIIAFFINLTPINVKEVLAKAEEVNKEQAKNWILHTVVSEKFYPDWKTLESEIKSTSYILPNKHLYKREKNWVNTVYLFDWFYHFSNDRDIKDNFYTDYELEEKLKEFKLTIDEEIDLITKKSFKNKTNLIKEIYILRGLAKKYKKRPRVELMSHLRWEIEKLSIKAWMSKSEYEDYLKENNERNSISLISLWKKWWVTHDELFSFIEENIEWNHKIKEEWNSIIVETSLYNNRYDKIIFWKDDYKIKKIESYKKYWNRISDLIIQEFETVEYISNSNTKNIFNPIKNELKLLKF